MKPTRFTEKQIIGVLEGSEARRLRQLENENAKLRRLLADTMLDDVALKGLLTKNVDARRQAGSGRTSPGL